MNRALVVLVFVSAIACDGEVAAPSDAGPEGPDDAGAVLTPPVELGLHEVVVIDTRRVVPSAGLPRETVPDHSNNNLDVTRFGGRVFLAWRTSPDHFAGPETVIHVVSSTDELAWTFEATFAVGSDLREPRFLEVGGRLFLYVAQLGTDAVTFVPTGVFATERTGDATWTELESIGLDGAIAWRTRVEHGVPYMTAYYGGEHIYRFDGLPLDVHLLTTSDGRVFAPVDAARPIVYSGGGSETDFALGDDGTLFGIIRNEAGDERGFGSMVCTAPAADITDWSCVTDPRKYDSPIVFWHDGEAYLIGRRHLTATGNFDLMSTEGTIPERAAAYGLDYVVKRKRCSLWRFVQGENRIAFILDLPSRGDTCFAGIVRSETDPSEIVVYNYSSDIGGHDVVWGVGQAGDTFIYRHALRFTRR